MKKIIHRLGVIGLIIAVLTPFIELPVVKAETTSCTTHLQNYMFLDVNWFTLNDDGETFLEGYDSENESNGYLTYTNFPYSFPENTTNDIEIKSVTVNDLNDSSYTTGMDTFWDRYTAGELMSTYHDVTGGGLVKGSVSSKKYDTNTIIFHGVWSNFDKNGEPVRNESSTRPEEISTDLRKSDIKNTIQYALKSHKNDMSAIIGTAENDGDDKFTLNDADEISSDGIDFFDEIANSNDSEHLYEDEETKYFSLAITRGIDYDGDAEDYLNKLIFGYKNTDNSIIVFTDETSTGTEALTEVTKAELSDKIKDSYSALKEYQENEDDESYVSSGKNIVKCTDCDIDDINFNTGIAYYWPAVVSVEYESCPKEASETEKWALAYESNVTNNDNSVTNMPSKLTDIAIGTDATVDSKAPSRTNYTFNNWCETKEGTGKCYKAGEKVTSPTSSKTITLYAQWVKGGTEENEKTGVISYVVGFITVGAIAGAIYLISKKKNFFKQI